MKEFTLHREQLIEADLDKVWTFFASARNLELLTPDWLTFKVLTPEPIDMGVGTLIDYQLKLHGLPLRWRSEITAWDPRRMFVDEQRRGPYHYWKHTHEFEETDGGVLVRDHVRYAVPGGSLVHRLFVAPDLERIWAHRSEQMERLFFSLKLVA